MTDDAAPVPAPDTDEDSGGRWMELVAAVILGVAAILTAISAYKAALLDGDALQGYTESTRTLNDSSTFYSQANQTYSQDQTIFIQYATAAQAKNSELQSYLLNLMRPELQKAVEWWEKTDDATTPFDEEPGNPYSVSDTDEAQRLEKQAAAQFKDGAAADDQGDKFELASVLLAITLFLGGIATLFKRRPTKLLMLGISGVSLGIGAVAVVVAFS